MNFLKAILEETKSALNAHEVRVCKRTQDRLPEYACCKVWPLVRADATLRKYLPAEEMDLGQFPDRRFMWGVINTFNPYWVEAYVDAAAGDTHKAQPHFKLWSDFKESGGVVSSVSSKGKFLGDWSFQ